MAPQFKTNIDKLEGVQLRPPEWEEEEKLCLGGEAEEGPELAQLGEDTALGPPSSSTQAHTVRMETDPSKWSVVGGC